MGPRRPQELAPRLPLTAGLEALPGGAGPVRARDDLAPAYARRVAYSDIDYNEHMNNARYVQWIQDAVPEDALAGAAALRLDINYLAELLPGAEARVLLGRAEPEADWPRRFAFEGRTEDGKPSFRAELGLR